VNTYLIGKDEVRAYVRDLVNRLEKIDPFPTVWCPVTKSGDAIQAVITDALKAHRPERLNGVRVVPIDVARAETGAITITFPESDPSAEFHGKSVLLLDGAIHSGETMRLCAAEVLKFGPAELSSYSLVMKAGAAFIPTFWGLGIDETDRAFFLLDQIPNNRLDAGTKEKQAPVHLERLSRSHVDKQQVNTTVKSMNRMTWSDRLFQMEAADAQPPCSYLLFRGTTIVGYLTVHASGDEFSIDEVAVDEKFTGQKYGGILMRFADTLARQGGCARVRLNAIEGKVSLYEKFGYRKISGRPPLVLDDETYYPMERTVLYHQRPRA